MVLLTAVFLLSACTTAQEEKEKMVELHFDEPFGAASFEDSSGNKHNGTCRGGRSCPTSGIRGMIGRAAGFNEGDVFVDVGVIEVGTSFSVEAWIRPDSVPRVHETIILGAQESKEVVAVEFNEEKGLRVRFVGDGPGNSTTDYSGRIEAGTKNHIIIVFDDKKDKAMIYVNGKKQVEGAYPDSISIKRPMQLTIGGGLDHVSFRGIIDEFAMYGSALSEKDVQTFYDKAQRLALAHVDEKPELHIKNENDVIAKRTNLIRHIWKDSGFPHKRMPDTIIEDIQDADLESLPNLKKIDKLVVKMDHGLESTIYYFHPIEGNNKLILYHEGHGKNFTMPMYNFFYEENGEKITRQRYPFEFFLEKGYSVLALNMPLTGINRKPENLFGLSDPSDLFVLESEYESMVKYFLEPVAVALNYALKDADYDSVSMVGFSGGGWVTTLYAAIDPRVSNSYPVAGTLPLHIRDRGRDLGGFENRIPQLYTIANYPEIYALGSYGRRQIQILNEDDPCCYATRERINYIKSYAKAVHETVQGSGGSFQVYIDNNEHHAVSLTAVALILKDIREWKRA